MSQNLNSLKKGYIGDYIGDLREILGVKILAQIQRSRKKGRGSPTHLGFRVYLVAG